jgi:hypothetical protein
VLIDMKNSALLNLHTQGMLCGCYNSFRFEDETKDERNIKINIYLPFIGAPKTLLFFFHCINQILFERN